MNRVAACLVLLLTLALATPARAASLEIIVKDAALAHVTAKGFTPGSVCYVSKAAADAPPCEGQCPVSFKVTSADFTLASAAPLLDKTDENGALVRGLLESGSAWCVSGQEPPKETKVTIKPPVLPLSTTLGAWRSLDDSSRLTWFGWDVAAFNVVFDKLGPLTCEFQPETKPKNGCQFVREKGRDGGPKLTFMADRPVTKDSTIVIKSGQKTVIALPLTDCGYTPTGALTNLYQDSEETRLELASSPGCLRQLAAFDTVTLALGATTIEATVEKDTAGDGRIRYLATHRVSTDLPLGSQELEIRFGRAVLGTLRVGVRAHGLKVTDDASHDPALAVSYGVEQLDSWQSGQSTDGMAVTTPNETDDRVFITNRAKLESVDSTLRELGQRLSAVGRDETECQDYWEKNNCHWQDEDGKELDPNDSDTFCKPAKFACEGQPPRCEGVSLEWKVDYCLEEIAVGTTVFSQADDVRLEAFRSRGRAWHVRRASWGDQVWFKETWLRRNDSRQVGLDSVEFAIFEERSDPLRAEVELHDAFKGVVLFRANVLLAKGARRESLPLPLAGALKIDCPQETKRKGPLERKEILNGQVRAVQDEDLDSGLCTLKYSPSLMTGLLEQSERSRARHFSTRDEAELKQRASDQLRFYGRQLVEVVVARGTEPSVTLAWSLDPTQEQELKLPGVKPRSGDYAITAHLKGPRPPDVVYRESRALGGTTSATAAAALADLEFSATLRPRGLGGWAGSGVRTFVTFPIRFTGLRFPAKTSELDSSNDVTAIQVAGVRAGVMGVIEPWNYDMRRNAWPVPVRFMTGLNLYDLASGNFAPAYLLGASIALPVMPLDGSPTARNIESTVSVGGFWELDLERSAPFRDGNHFLLTLGVDLLSLFSE